MVTVRTILSEPQQVLIAVWEHGIADVIELLEMVKRIGRFEPPEVHSFHQVLRYRERVQFIPIGRR